MYVVFSRNKGRARGSRTLNRWVIYIHRKLLSISKQLVLFLCSILSDACRSGSLQISISITERPYSAQTAAGVSDGPDLRILQLHAGMHLKINLAEKKQNTNCSNTIKFSYFCWIKEVSGSKCSQTFPWFFCLQESLLDGETSPINSQTKRCRPTPGTSTPLGTWLLHVKSVTQSVGWC